ncbi:hypothetical protein HYX17_04410 [Candidatus Woesearchaeota archaeon]|nr:hypothetical protein [Candidatus Woesearchaeota archaeon]
MKKVVIVLFLLTTLFISACSKEVVNESSFCKKPYFEFKKGECCLDNNNNSVCDESEPKEEVKSEMPAPEQDKVEEAVVEEIKEPVITQPEEPKEETFKMSVGDIVKFNKLEIKLLELNIGENLNAVFDVGGKKTTIFNTKNIDIVGDLSLYIDTIAGSGDDTSLNLVVKKYTLDPDSYLVRFGDTLNIGGKSIYIRDIMKGEKEEAILIDVGTLLKERIQEGRSETYDNVEITNVKVFFKGSKLENYALLKIVTK